jgi:hypothetical protein
MKLPTASKLFPKLATVDSEKKAVSGLAAKILSVLIVVGVVLSSYAAIKSLWIEPSYAKFAYQNTAAISGLAAAFMVPILSGVQKDIYWVTRKKAIKFDERQLQSRQQIFEISYKIGAVLILSAAWILPGYAHSLPAILSNNYGDGVPSHLFWPLYDLAILFIALPLIVAAWHRQLNVKTKHKV